MKRVLYFVVILSLFLTFSVYATSGGLQKKSIKTCPDGITYGYHQSNGVIHWHRAVQSTGSYSGWNADGDPFPGDPCPNTGSKTTATTTKAPTTTTKAPTTTTVAPKVVAPVTTTITTEETTERIVITESTTTVEVSTTTTLSAKLYDVNKIELKANGTSITINEKNGTVSILGWEDKIEFTINDGYTIKVYDGDKLIDNIINYEKDKEYKVEVYQGDGLKETYSIYVERYSILASILIMIIVVAIMLGIPGVIIFVIIKVVNKKKA